MAPLRSPGRQKGSLKEGLEVFIWGKLGDHLIAFVGPSWAIKNRYRFLMSLGVVLGIWAPKRAHVAANVGLIV